MTAHPTSHARAAVLPLAGGAAARAPHSEVVTSGFEFWRATGRRFMSHVEVTDGCWIWRGAMSPTGYGSVKRRGRSHTAHRIAIEELTDRGAVPEGLQVDHICRNRRCVRPSHLQVLTPAEHNRVEGERITHCPRGHAYTAENTRTQVNWAGGVSRKCRTCERVGPWRNRNAEQKEKKKK